LISHSGTPSSEAGRVEGADVGLLKAAGDLGSTVNSSPISDEPPGEWVKYQGLMTQVGKHFEAGHARQGEFCNNAVDPLRFTNG